MIVATSDSALGVRVGHDPTRGVYDAHRTAALSGVPRRTLHWWATHDVYRPSVEPEPRTRLWSWYDLVALRTIDWLRRPHEDVRRVPIARIREMLHELDRRGLSRSQLHDLVVRTAGGKLYFEVDEQLVRADRTGQAAIPDALAVVRPYQGAPDLLQPRPLLRIIPGKLSGEPHVAGTRIPTQALFALHADGYSASQIRDMYPDASKDAIEQAIDLEESLSKRAA